MKKFFLTILILAGLCVGAIFVFVIPHLNSMTDQKIRQFVLPRLAEKKVTLNYEALQIHLGLPMSVRFFNVTIVKPPQANIKIQELDVSVGVRGNLLKWKELTPELEVELFKPQIALKSLEAEAPTSAVQDTGASSLPIQNLEDLKKSIPYLQDVRAKVRIQDLSVLISNPEDFFEARNLQMKLEIPSLRSNISIESTGQIKIHKALLPFFIPYTLQTSLRLDQGVVKLLPSRLKILSLESLVQGDYQPSTKKMNFTLKIEAPDLAKIPLQLGTSPIKSWKGAVSVQVQGSGTTQAPQLAGHLDLQNVEAVLESQQNEMLLRGPLQLQAQTRFSVQSIPTGPTISLDPLKVSLDLTQAQIQWGSLFRKEAAIPLRLQMSGTVHDRIQIEDLNLALAQISLGLKGNFGINPLRSQTPIWPAQFSVNLKPANLSGLEKMFLPLSQYPLQGQASLQLAFEGDLKNFKAATIDLKDLKFSQVSTQIQYKNEKMSLVGPVVLDLQSQLSMRQLDVRSGFVKAHADLSNLQINWKDQFRKSSGDLLKLDLQAQKKGTQLTLEKSRLSLLAGDLNFDGKPPLSLTSPFDLKIEAPNLILQKLKKWLPPYQALIPGGVVKIRTSLNGNLNADDFLKSPLNSQTEVTAHLSEVKLPPMKKAGDTQDQNQAPATPPEALLKESEIFKRARVRAQIIIDRFEMAPLAASRIQSQAQFQSGSLKADAEVGQIFDGSVKLKDLNLNLFKADPPVTFRAETRGVRIEKVNAWILPDFEKLLKGSADIVVSGTTHLPGTPHFLENLKAQGNMKIPDGVLSTVALADMLKDILAKVPGAKPEQISSRGPLQASITSPFSIQNSKVELNPFDAKTPRQEELFLKGSLGFNMQVDVAGSLFIKDKIGGGSFFEANEDSQGRLEIPVKIRGSALKPELSMAQETVSKMISKTIEFEKKKASAQLQNQMKKELDKQKEKLGEDVKKKLQNLFK